jgi:hypothetical protein
VYHPKRVKTTTNYEIQSSINSNCSSVATIKIKALCSTSHVTLFKVNWKVGKETQCVLSTQNNNNTTATQTKQLHTKLFNFQKPGTALLTLSARLTGMWAQKLKI